MKLLSPILFAAGFAFSLQSIPAAANLVSSGDVLPIPANPSADFFVGNSGTGHFTINAGSTQTNTNGRIGDQAGSDGTAIVTDTGSGWINTAELFIGSFGTGDLTIQNSGSVSNTNGKIGDQIGATGTVTVNGPGSVWTNNAELFVGSAGNGSLSIENGGAVTSTNGKIGDQSGSQGMVTVTDAGSSWINSAELFVGSFGSGDLIIQNGGSVSNTNGKIGDQAGSDGSVTVTGSGSNWTSTADLFVGQQGTAELTIENGGAVEVTNTARVGEQGTLNLAMGELSALDLQLEGVLNILLSDQPAGIFDIGNTALLGGTLEVNLLNSFMPEVGDSFTFLYANTINSSFDHYLFPQLDQGIFEFTSGNGYASLRVSAVPLPAPVILLASALVSLFIARRKSSV